MKNLLIALTIAGICCLTEGVLAQEKPAGIFSQLKELGTKMRSDSETLEKTMHALNQMKKESQLQKLYDADEEALAILNELKNPFIPQLPQPEIIIETEVAQPQADTRPRPEILAPPPPPPAPAQPEREERVVERQPVPAFKISGMIWNSDLPQAIINEQIVTVGDNVSGWTITEIEKAGVTLYNKNADNVFETDTVVIKPEI